MNAFGLHLKKNSTFNPFINMLILYLLLFVLATLIYITHNATRFPADNDAVRFSPKDSDAAAL